MVKSGRHPLQEQCVDTFVANDIGMLDSDEEIQPGKVIMIFHFYAITHLLKMKKYTQKIWGHK